MTYFGKVQNGTVVIDGDKKPAEGEVLRMETIEASDEALSPVAKALLSIAGITDGPEDGSINVDHYLYGLPKK